MKLDWTGCINQKFAKEITPDAGQINSIIESALSREKTARMLPIDDTTKETVLSLMYDVLRELLEAISLKNNYKIYNHECYTSFLRVVMKDDAFAEEFDSLRMLRNRINYYGKKIPLDDAKAAISNAKNLVKKAKALISKAI